MMVLVKKIMQILKKCILFFLFISISACGKTSELNYDNGFFTLTYPNTWYMSSSFEDIESLKNYEKPVVSFFKQENEKISHLVVFYEPWKYGDVKMKDFLADQVILLESLPSYALKDMSNTTIAGVKTKLYNYTAVQNEKTIEYLQTFLYSGEAAYIITAASEQSFTEDTRSEIESMITSFSLKE